MRRLVLRLLLVIGLCLTALAGGGGLVVPSVSAASLADATHHPPEDAPSGQPPCALVRCECHACPHLAAPRPAGWALPLDRPGPWRDKSHARKGDGPQVELPPPRTPIVEAT